VKNILLLTDFSDSAWNAAVYALHFFKKTKCNFFLFHVCTPSTFAEFDAPYLLSRENLEILYLKPAKQKLKQVVKQLVKEVPQNPNHKIYTLTEYGPFVETVKKQLDEKRITGIVMGTKGASRLEASIMGSNTGNVITKVKCTTLIVPLEATVKPIKEIAFPTDFILSYEIKTLNPILELLEETKAFLSILHILGKNKKLTLNQQSNKELLEDFFSACKQNTYFLTNKQVEEAVQCFIESRNIDMVVMVAKNLSYFQQIVFHTKVEKVSYHTHIPFLVLHE